eukprot:9625-Heterococcus_DN1.PRE.2
MQFHTDRARNNEEDRELRFVRGGGGLNAADNAGGSTGDDDKDPPATAIGNGATAIPTIRGTAFPTTFGGAAVTAAPTLSGTAAGTATGTAAGTAAGSNCNSTFPATPFTVAPTAISTTSGTASTTTAGTAAGSNGNSTFPATPFTVAPTAISTTSGTAGASSTTTARPTTAGASATATPTAVSSTAAPTQRATAAQSTVQPTAAATAFETVISTIITAVTAPPSLAATTPLNDVPDDNGFGKDDVVGNDDIGLGVHTALCTSLSTVSCTCAIYKSCVRCHVATSHSECALAPSLTLLLRVLLLVLCTTGGEGGRKQFVIHSIIDDTGGARRHPLRRSVQVISEATMETKSGPRSGNLLQPPNMQGRAALPPGIMVGTPTGDGNGTVVGVYIHNQLTLCVYIGAFPAAQVSSSLTCPGESTVSLQFYMNDTYGTALVCTGATTCLSLRAHTAAATCKCYPAVLTCSANCIQYQWQSISSSSQLLRRLHDVSSVSDAGTCNFDALRGDAGVFHSLDPGGCNVISDCPLGSSCTGGRCVRDGGLPCQTDQNCPFSTYCISGICTPNGLSTSTSSGSLGTDNSSTVVTRVL